MCVICYLPKKAEMPSEKILRSMWECNPDGGGIMWRQGKKVHFSKGYFDFETLYRDLLVVKKDYNFECAVHFRIATSGKINPAMCHPFIITNQEGKIVKTEGVTDCCIMHNGVINIDNRPYFSDTAEYVMSCLYPQYKKDNSFFLHLTPIKEMLLYNEINHSRMLFFGKKGVKMLGDWHKYKDFYCSNLRFTYYLEDRVF